jgi:hypothetical protein
MEIECKFNVINWSIVEWFSSNNIYGLVAYKLINFEINKWNMRRKEKNE